MPAKWFDCEKCGKDFEVRVSFCAGGCEAEIVRGSCECERWSDGPEWDALVEETIEAYYEGD